MEIRRIRDITHISEDIVIQVRVCRMWRWKKRNQNEMDGIEYVLADKENHAIYAIMRFHHDSTQVSEGLTYEISKFQCTKNLEKYRIVPHYAMLFFDKNTKFTYIPQLYQSIPLYWFAFVDFSQLKTRIRDDKHYSDVVDRVVSTNPTIERNQNARVPTTCRVQIENIRNERVTVCLTNESVKKFSTAIATTAFQPTVVVFTSTKVRGHQDDITLQSTINTSVFINPWIDETHQLRASVHQRLDPRQLQQITEPIVDKEVLYDIFITRAEMKIVEYENGWYYIGCEKCNTELTKESEISEPKCHKHKSQGGVPLYNFKITLHDETGTIKVLARGGSANSLLGIDCAKLVNEELHIDRNRLPDILTDRLLRNFIWEINYQQGEDLKLEAVHRRKNTTEDGIAVPVLTNTVRRINELTKFQFTDDKGKQAEKEDDQKQNMRELQLLNVASTSAVPADYTLLSGIRTGTDIESVDRDANESTSPSTSGTASPSGDSTGYASTELIDQWLDHITD